MERFRGFTAHNVVLLNQRKRLEDAQLLERDAQGIHVWRGDCLGPASHYLMGDTEHLLNIWDDLAFNNLTHIF